MKKLLLLVVLLCMISIPSIAQPPCPEPCEQLPPPNPECPCDLDGDGRVTILDIMTVVDSLGAECGDPCGCYYAQVDFNANCVMDMQDLRLVVRHWNETCP